MTAAPAPLRIGYVVKRYPRFSETFVVNEILAHERAGVPVQIFAVRRVNEPCFQSILGQVRSPVHYVPDSVPKAETLWAALREGARTLPEFWPTLESLAEDADLPDLLQAIHLAVAARNAGVTHFHAHFATVAATVARLAARLAHIDYSVTAHAKDIFHVAIDRRQLHQKLSEARAVVTVSDYNVAFLAREYGLGAPLLERIYNGLRLSEFPFRSPADRRRHIVAVGRLVEKKGLAVLVAACAIMRERGHSFTCDIIGDGPERETLTSAIAYHHLEDRVQLSGSLPRPEVVRALQRAAVSALPCIVADDGDRDGLPTVLIEAMALGTPCISTDVTGIPEVVCGGVTGLCVAQRDPAALADALTLLLDDGALRHRLATNARALVERDFDVDRNAARLRAHIAGASRLRAGQLPHQLRAAG